MSDRFGWIKRLEGKNPTEPQLCVGSSMIIEVLADRTREPHTLRLVTSTGQLLQMPPDASLKRASSDEFVPQMQGKDAVHLPTPEFTTGASGGNTGRCTRRKKEAQ
jgi:hypothetical protein